MHGSRYNSYLICIQHMLFLDILRFLNSKPRIIEHNNQIYRNNICGWHNIFINLFQIMIFSYFLYIAYMYNVSSIRSNGSFTHLGWAENFYASQYLSCSLYSNISRYVVYYCTRPFFRIKKKKKNIHVVYGRGWSHWPTIPFLFGWYTSQTSLIIILYPARDPATFCCFSRLRSYFRPTASSSWRGNALGFPKPQIMGSPWPP